MSDKEKTCPSEGRIEKIKIGYEVSHDDEGFAVNVNLNADNGEPLDPETIPAYLILVTKSICDEMGIDFHKLLSNALAIEEEGPRWVFLKKMADA